MIAISGAYLLFFRSTLPVVTITNNSAQSLKKVMLLGTGFSEGFDSIEPHQTVSRAVHVRGESGLEIRFTTKLGEVRKDDLAYLETSGGYIAHITIDEKLAVSCESHFNGY